MIYILSWKQQRDSRFGRCAPGAVAASKHGKAPGFQAIEQGAKGDVQEETQEIDPPKGQNEGAKIFGSQVLEGTIAEALER